MYTHIMYTLTCYSKRSNNIKGADKSDVNSVYIYGRVCMVCFIHGGNRRDSFTLETRGGGGGGFCSLAGRQAAGRWSVFMTTSNDLMLPSLSHVHMSASCLTLEGRSELCK